MHNIPGQPLGTFATRAGPITASEALFEIAVDARGGHAAMPHTHDDAIVVGAQLVGALQVGGGSHCVCAVSPTPVQWVVEGARSHQRLTRHPPRRDRR